MKALRQYFAVAVSLLIAFLVSSASAQIYTVLHSFTNAPDGSNPFGGLVLSGNTLFGTTFRGGDGGDNGTIFKINTNGSGYAVVKSFSGGFDGDHPAANLILAGDVLFGTTAQGQSLPAYYGTIFSIKTDGTEYKVLKSFLGYNEGSGPLGCLELFGTTLFGTCNLGNDQGLQGGAGTVFRMDLTDTNFNVLQYFNGSYPTNGGFPYAGVTIVGNSIFGTTTDGGTNQNPVGVVFRMDTSGSNFTVLKAFAVSDGSTPQGKLIYSGGVLYGTTAAGGTNAHGTVFKINTDGTGFATLKHFGGSDGGHPWCELVLSGNTLYGTTWEGGLADGSGNGTIFQIDTDGTNFRVLKRFTGADGNGPQGNLLLAANTLYGATGFGGDAGYGTVFSLSLSPPKLSITTDGTNAVLSWPAGSVDFILQSTTNLPQSAAWATNDTLPVVINGQNTVTNPFTDVQMFYRLSQ